MQISEITDKLQHGDLSRAAEVVGCSQNMVRSVLYGRRNEATKLGKRIVAALGLLVKAREEIKAVVGEEANAN